MTNSLATPHRPAAILLAALLLGAAPLLAQESTADTAPSSAPPAVTTSSQPSQVEAQQAQPVPAQTAGASSIRIVRLSQVVGVAQMDRGIDRGFETAFANLPITQGSRLLTGEGVAEVEFEDNSSLRLTPHSEVEFPLLSLGRDGTRTSTVRVRQGNVYISLAKNKENNFTLLFGQETVTLAPATHIALAITPTQRRLDVMDGSVQDTNGAITTTVAKKKALVFTAANPAAPTLVSKNEAGPYDDWDKQAVQYHSRFANSSHYASAPYSYGVADLNYYGNFGSVGGCGNMWRPYMASANWSPYANGTWAYYSGAGYSWVSPYPWGWLPYHSGSWDYCPGAGWGWRPGSQWNGLQNAPVGLLSKSMGRVPGNAPGPRQLKPPLAGPKPVGPTTIAVRQGPIVASRLNNENGTFVFRNDSAGLGVPRGSFGKLGGISNGVMHHGTVERAVFQEPSAGANPGAGNPSQNGGLTGTNRSLGNGRGAATAGIGGNAVSSPRSLALGGTGGARSASPGVNSSRPSFGGYSGGGGGGGMSRGSMSGSMSSGGMSAGGGMRGSMSSGGAASSSGGHH